MNQRAKRLEKKLIEVELENGAILKSKSVIVSTVLLGNVGVPGEAEFKIKGVAYCPRDGPLFTGKGELSAEVTLVLKRLST